MTRDMYREININLTAITQLNIFKELKYQIETKNNKETKINQINELRHQYSN